MAYTSPFVFGYQIPTPWFQEVDTLLNGVLGGAQSTAAVLAALGISGAAGITAVPVPISEGGTGANSQSGALAALGALAAGVFTQAGIGEQLYPTSAAEAAALAAMTAPGAVVNPWYPPGYVDRYVANGGSGTDSAIGFNAAYAVCKSLGCRAGYGATAPYYINSTVNGTTTGGPNQNSVVFEYDGAGAQDAANLPIVAQVNNIPVFDFTGTSGVSFYRGGITTKAGFTPSIGLLFARNSTAGGAGLWRLRDFYILGAFTIDPVYNYGGEDTVASGCYFENQATTASTSGITYTANNVAGVISAYTAIAAGSQSTTDHTLDSCQLYNAAGTATSYCVYLDAVTNLRIAKCWMACAGSTAGGQAYVGVNQTNGPSNNITITDFMGENTPFLPAYGILFFNAGQINVNWSVKNCTFPNANLAISCNGTLSGFCMENVTEQPSVSHGLSANAMTNGVVNAQTLPLAITTSTNNLLTGYTERWTIGTRVNDNWVDTGTANKTWAPVATGLTHSGALTITNARMLLFGNQCAVEMTIAAATSLTPTAGQTITGLPFAALSNSVVDVVDATTPINLGQGVVSGTTLVMPAFSAGAHSVTIRSTYFVA